MNKLYVYGTLRPGKSPTITIPGQLFQLSWFPGVLLNGQGTFQAEPIEVDDQNLAQLDRYEGYYPEAPEKSLFVRTPILDGEIYVFNQPVGEEHFHIVHGDWLKWEEEKHVQVQSG